MPLPQAQWLALKNHINANVNTIPYGESEVAINALPQNSDAAVEIAKWYNNVNVPDFWVWRTKVREQEITQQKSRVNTDFIWQGNGYISRSNGELKCWDKQFETGTANASLANVRKAFEDIFSGGGNAALNVIHVSTICRRQASWVERILTSGQGLDTNTGASTMVFEGPLTPTDVENARNN